MGTGRHRAHGNALYFNTARTIRAEVADYEHAVGIELVPIVPLAQLLSEDGSSVGGIVVLGRTDPDIQTAARAKGFAASFLQFSATHPPVSNTNRRVPSVEDKPVTRAG